MEDGEQDEGSRREQQRLKNSDMAEEDSGEEDDREQKRKLEESEPQLLFAIGCLSPVETLQSSGIFR